MTETWPRRVLLLHEAPNFGGDFDEAIVAGFEANGCAVHRLPKGTPWRPEYDLVIGYGPFTAQRGHLLTVAEQVRSLHRAQRPLFVWWLTENTPNPRLPGWLLHGLSTLRLQLDDLLLPPSGAPLTRLRAYGLKGHRLRIFGQLRRVSGAGALDILVTTSAARAAFYRRHGIDSLVTPLGYHAIYGSDLGLGRDIDVAFLGNTQDRRRKLILPRLTATLRRRGLRVVVENRLYGPQRSQFLNRSRILLNILRAPQDFVGQRLMLGAANKALVVSERMLDPAPFVAGRHFVAAPLGELADVVQRYVEDDDARERIVEEAHAFVTQELTAARVAGRIVERARQLRRSERPLA